MNKRRPGIINRVRRSTYHLRMLSLSIELSKIIALIAGLVLFSISADKEMFRAYVDVLSGTSSDVFQSVTTGPQSVEAAGLSPAEYR